MSIDRPVHFAFLEGIMNEQYRVKATQLNLRSRPLVSNLNRLALLPQGHLVTKVEELAQPWWKVNTTFANAPLTGFVHSSFLERVTAGGGGNGHATGLVAVHMPENNPASKRSSIGGRAHPLGEPGRPSRSAAGPPAKAASLGNIVAWLDVERSKRYLPDPPPGRNTYCNIYAYDYCHLAGAYLPRVWWSSKAASKLAQGIPVAPEYGVSLFEQTANLLFNWLGEYGPDFGWERTFDLDALQRRANEGFVCIACATTGKSTPGHITAVVPETATAAAKRSHGKVTIPLQSQAGRQNARYFASAWWTKATFQDHGFWLHA